MAIAFCPLERQSIHHHNWHQRATKGGLPSQSITSVVYIYHQFPVIETIEMTETTPFVVRRALRPRANTHNCLAAVAWCFNLHRFRQLTEGVYIIGALYTRKERIGQSNYTGFRLLRASSPLPLSSRLQHDEKAAFRERPLQNKSHLRNAFLNEASFLSAV